MTQQVGTLPDNTGRSGVAQPGGNPQSVTAYVDTRKIHQEADAAHQKSADASKTVFGLKYKHGQTGATVRVSNDLGPQGVQWEVVDNTGFINGAITGQSTRETFEREFQRVTGSEQQQSSNVPQAEVQAQPNLQRK